MTFVPFTDAARIADDFLALLNRLNIDPLNRGRVESEFLSISELLDIWKSGQARPDPHGNIVRTAAGVHDFAAKVLAAQNLPEFSSFHAHLKLIAQGTLHTSLSQMDKAESDDAARKLVELYVAALAIHCGTNIRLDDPNHSKGDNPDILLDFEGCEWAIAIKTVASTSGQTIFERIKEAAEQIDRSGAERGLILLNVKDSVDHKTFWSRTFVDENEAVAALRSEVEALCEAADKDRPQSEWDAVFSGKARRPVLFMAQTVVRLDTAASSETATPIKILLACNFGGALDPDAQDLAESLTHFMQVLVDGIPP